LFKRLLHILLFISPLISFGQNTFGVDRAIDRLVEEFSKDFSQVIEPGNRLYVLQPEYNININGYVSERIHDGLTNAVRSSKFNLVYQPFLRDHVLRKVYSSDSLFRIEHTSYLRAQYPSMRTVLDTMASYGIDHFLASTLQWNEENDLMVLNVFMIESSTLIVKWSKKFYSDPNYKDDNTKTGLNISFMASQPFESIVYRDYSTNSSTSLVGPYDDFAAYQSVQIEINQSFNNIWGAGIVLGGSSLFLPNGFKDTVVGLNSMNVPFFEIGASVFASFWPKKNSFSDYWMSLKQLGFIGKPTLIDTHLSTETRLEVHLTSAVSVFTGMKFFGPIKRSTLQFSEGITLNTPALCYGAHISL
tara:strand:+ start:3038 stop:4117 length:1080 start_codon:yes stop_codon:yes gene_type:complete